MGTWATGCFGWLILLQLFFCIRIIFAFFRIFCFYVQNAVEEVWIYFLVIMLVCHKLLFAFLKSFSTVFIFWCNFILFDKKGKSIPSAICQVMVKLCKLGYQPEKQWKWCIIIKIAMSVVRLGRCISLLANCSGCNGSTLFPCFLYWVPICWNRGTWICHH